MNKLEQLLLELKEKGALRLENGRWNLSSDLLDNRKLTESERISVEWLCLVEHKFELHQKTPPEYLTKAQINGLEKHGIIPLLNPPLALYVEQSKSVRKRKRQGLFLRLFLLLLGFGIAYQFFAKQPTTEIKEFVWSPTNEWMLGQQEDSLGQLKYGFLTADGQAKIPFVYDEASPFDQFGFARVVQNGQAYLIDTSNHRYPLAERLDDINAEILAVRLVEQALEELPAVILKNPQVKILYLRGNLIQELPIAIQNMENLTILDLSYNQLTEIPDNIEQLKQLKYLDVSNNSIEKITERLANMDSLVGVNLYNNPIEKAPEVLVQRSQLTLNMGGNRMRYQQGSNSYRNELPAVSEQKRAKKQANLEPATTTDYNLIKTKKTTNQPSTPLSTNQENKTVDNQRENAVSKNKSLDCTAVFTKNYKAAKNHILESNYILFFKKNDVFSGGYFTADKQTVLLHIDYTAATEQYHEPLDAQDKIMFLNVKGEKRLFSFHQSATQNVTVGAYESSNRLVLSNEDLQWLSKDRVHKIRIVNIAKNKMYPYNIVPERQQQIQQTAGCLLQEL